MNTNVDVDAMRKDAVERVRLFRVGDLCDQKGL